jgi:hypothetical protein
MKQQVPIGIWREMVEEELATGHAMPGRGYHEGV